MKRMTAASLALALTLLVSGLAFAMDMSHDGMKAGDMTPAQSMKVMEDNLRMMKADVGAMQDPAGREAAMKAMNAHMTDMHHGMAAMEAHAKQQGDAKMKAGMTEMNKEMMTTMKGMGLMKKDADKGMAMMREGLGKMERTLSGMKGMM